MLASCPGSKLLNDVKAKKTDERKTCRHALTLSRKPKIWSFDVVVLQRTAKKCTKCKTHVQSIVLARCRRRRRCLGPVHTYPEIFVSANFFMRIHLASTRVRRIRSAYPEISVYALQSGNFCIRCVSGYVWTLVSVYFLYTLTSQYQNQSFSARDFPKWRRAETLCYFQA